MTWVTANFRLFFILKLIRSDNKNTTMNTTAAWICEQISKITTVADNVRHESYLTCFPGLFKSFLCSTEIFRRFCQLLTYFTIFVTLTLQLISHSSQSLLRQNAPYRWPQHSATWTTNLLHYVPKLHFWLFLVNQKFLHEHRLRLFRSSKLHQQKSL